MCISTAQARTKRVSRGIGVRPFPCRFPYEMALVTCPRAFRLRRLAQNDVRGLSPGLESAVFPVNFHIEISHDKKNNRLFLSGSCPTALLRNGNAGSRKIAKVKLLRERSRKLILVLDMLAYVCETLQQEGLDACIYDCNVLCGHPNFPKNP